MIRNGLNDAAGERVLPVEGVSTLQTLGHVAGTQQHPAGGATAAAAAPQLFLGRHVAVVSSEAGQPPQFMHIQPPAVHPALEASLSQRQILDEATHTSILESVHYAAGQAPVVSGEPGMLETLPKPSMMWLMAADCSNDTALCRALGKLRKFATLRLLEVLDHLTQSDMFPNKPELVGTWANALDRLPEDQFLEAMSGEDSCTVWAMVHEFCDAKVLVEWVADHTERYTSLISDCIATDGDQGEDSALADRLRIRCENKPVKISTGNIWEKFLILCHDEETDESYKLLSLVILSRAQIIQGQLSQGLSTVHQFMPGYKKICGENKQLELHYLTVKDSRMVMAWYLSIFSNIEKVRAQGRLAGGPVDKSSICVNWADLLHESYKLLSSQLTMHTVEYFNGLKASYLASNNLIMKFLVNAVMDRASFAEQSDIEVLESDSETESIETILFQETGLVRAFATFSHDEHGNRTNEQITDLNTWLAKCRELVENVEHTLPIEPVLSFIYFRQGNAGAAAGKYLAGAYPENTSDLRGASKTRRVGKNFRKVAGNQPTHVLTNFNNLSDSDRKLREAYDRILHQNLPSGVARSDHLKQIFEGFDRLEDLINNFNQFACIGYCDASSELISSKFSLPYLPCPEIQYPRSGSNTLKLGAQSSGYTIQTRLAEFSFSLAYGIIKKQKSYDVDSSSKDKPTSDVINFDVIVILFDLLLKYQMLGDFSEKETWQKNVFLLSMLFAIGMNFNQINYLTDQTKPMVIEKIRYAQLVLLKQMIQQGKSLSRYQRSILGEFTGHYFRAVSMDLKSTLQQGNYAASCCLITLMGSESGFAHRILQGAKIGRVESHMHAVEAVHHACKQLSEKPDSDVQEEGDIGGDPDTDYGITEDASSFFTSCDLFVVMLKKILSKPQDFNILQLLANADLCLNLRPYLERIFRAIAYSQEKQDNCLANLTGAVAAAQKMIARERELFFEIAQDIEELNKKQDEKRSGYRSKIEQLERANASFRAYKKESKTPHPDEPGRLLSVAVATEQKDGSEIEPVGSDELHKEWLELEQILNSLMEFEEGCHEFRKVVRELDILGSLVEKAARRITMIYGEVKKFESSTEVKEKFKNITCQWPLPAPGLMASLLNRYMALVAKNVSENISEVLQTYTRNIEKLNNIMEGQKKDRLIRNKQQQEFGLWIDLTMVDLAILSNKQQQINEIKAHLEKSAVQRLEVLTIVGAYGPGAAKSKKANEPYRQALKKFKKMYQSESTPELVNTRIISQFKQTAEALRSNLAAE